MLPCAYDRAVVAAVRVDFVVAAAVVLRATFADRRVVSSSPSVLLY